MLHFEIVSDLYSPGRSEDGTEYTAEVYYLQAEDERGNRWAHDVSFPGCVRHEDDEGWPHFEDIREAAMLRAQRLLERIEAAGGQVCLDRHWHSVRPCYGSRAYIAYGQFDDWMDEQRERSDARGFM